MNVIDLSTVREARAQAREWLVDFGHVLGDLACKQAERAFAVAEPLYTSDPTLAAGVVQVVRRHLLHATRKAIPKEWSKDAKACIADQVRNLYRGRLLALEDEAGVRWPGGYDLPDVTGLIRAL